MGQSEIKNLLLKEYKKNPNKYFKCSEIALKLGFGDKPSTQLYRQINSLVAWGYLEVKVLSWLPPKRAFKWKD